MTERKTDLLPAVMDHSNTQSLDRLDEILVTGEMDVEIIDDPAEISRQMVAQLLAAPDDLALQSFGEAEPWGDYLDRPFELHGFRWRKSDFEGEGAPIYFIVDAILLEDGSRKVLTTGSMSVLAQLSNMARRGTLVGGVWQLTEAETPTRAGYKPRWLTQPAQVKEAAQQKAAADAAAAQAAAPAAE